MILIIDSYDSFTYNVVEIFKNLKLRVLVVKSDSEKIYELAKKSLLICIGPGTGEPKKYPLIKKMLKKNYKKKPILGICLGHQIICSFFKLKIIRSKKIVHGLKIGIFLKKDSLFKGIPRNINVIRYNSLTVEYKKKKKIRFIAFSKKNREIMIMKHKYLPILSFQFHPDSYFCKYGKRIIKNFLLENDIFKKNKNTKWQNNTKIIY
ncbi:Anthranilate synthase amidotransferase component [Candidatus Vidania fulgoroideae]|nr:Anthranilate synthase amidotransferase component [Candidatus Vidania fulgoroideae]